MMSVDDYKRQALIDFVNSVNAQGLFYLYDRYKEHVGSSNVEIGLYENTEESLLNVFCLGDLLEMKQKYYSKDDDFVCIALKRNEIASFSDDTIDELISDTDLTDYFHDIISSGKYDMEKVNGSALSDVVGCFSDCCWDYVKMRNGDEIDAVVDSMMSVLSSEFDSDEDEVKYLLLKTTSWEKLIEKLYSRV